MKKTRLIISYIIPALLVVAGLATALYPAYTEMNYRSFQEGLKKQEESAARSAGVSSTNYEMPAGVVAKLMIPKIDLDVFVLPGTSGDILMKGVGHYEETALPGKRGNSALAGHRTMYGHPFRYLDELALGDDIITRTANGEFVYEVIGKRKVQPTDTSVLETGSGRRLTLTTCDPVGSASQRLIVVARLARD